ncbi:MAG: hypothetical protein ACOC1F_00265 [Myxococcota bacterium]
MRLVKYGIVPCAFALAGCTSDPIEDNQPSVVVKACCAEARERITTVADVATDDFRDRCNACRPGSSKRSCAAAASKLHDTIKHAYGEFSMPMSCTRMKAKLAEHGVE